MRKLIGVAAAVILGFSAPVWADCQDEVDELREKINENEDDYSKEARREAKRHLAAAELNRVNPVNCREDLRKARETLRQGRGD